MPPSEMTFEAVPESAARARRFLREQAVLDGMRHAEVDLLITELVGNVIGHSPTARKFMITVDDRRDLGLTVTLSHPHPQPMEAVDSGVGFLLLDRLTKSWRHEFDGELLHVSFVVRTPGTTAISADVTDEDLVARMAEDPAFSDELLKRYEDLAGSIARRYRGKGLDNDDLLQVANMALLKAIQRYDPTIGSLGPYAAATISGELKRALRDRGWAIRVPRSLQERALEVANVAEDMTHRLKRRPELHELAEEMDLTADEVAEALEARRAYVSNSMDVRSESTGTTPLERLEDEDSQLLLTVDRVMVEEAIASLPGEKRHILHLRFNEDMTQSQIAEIVGISQMHVSRLLASALEELRSTLDEESET